MKITAHAALLLSLVAACKLPPSRLSPAAIVKSSDVDNGEIMGGSKSEGSGDEPKDPDSPEEGKDEALQITFHTALPRLTHDEWENSVRDIFLLPKVPGLAQGFSRDDNSTIFYNDSATNKVTTNLWKDYQEASEEVGKRISADDNQVKTLVVNAPAGETIERAKAVLKPIILRAYRRPATEAELEGLGKIYVDGRRLTGGKIFDNSGIRAATVAILQSPQFIYHPEYGAKKDQVAVLTPYETAARLSYAIWKSVPDQALFEAAEKGKLESDEDIKVQVARMIKDKRATDTIRYFVNEVFETKKFVNLVKDKALFPKFPNDLGDTLKREAEMFIDDVVIKNNGGITKLLTTSYTFVNDKTAPLYEVALPGTMELTKVELDPTKRAGLVTQLGWLASNATNQRTSTIHRGFSVMNRIACDSLPPMVGTDSRPPTEFKTRRDEVKAKTGTCGAQCHNNYINPPAFALEAFDAAGVYRDKENGNPIDTSGIYGEEKSVDAPTRFKNAVELMKGLSERTTTHECYVKRAIELLYNRRVSDLDRSIVKRLGKKSMDGMGTTDIIVELLTDSALLRQRSDNE